ncbi:Os07g0482887 [Oryza sativa Japonica Group]|jgi:hypothetical protein|uniref:Os07g0482887 protein n=1 Tax=Oryza sativa subsp. japonica TaxID=39947 RepID=A0A0P0X5P2_ORYSJ|nr:hypothetical protein EE612_039240 [Oryza sativa]BAT01501.1 Os07g0482887 [Oryza sativa Japonica Group]
MMRSSPSWSFPAREGAILSGFQPKELGRKAPDELVNGSIVRGEALFAKDVICSFWIPAPEQLTLLLKYEPVHLWI